jgi:hypothetical protein
LDRRAVISSFKDGLHSLGFKDRQIAGRYSFADIRRGRSLPVEVSLAAFSGHPLSYRNACVGVAFSGSERPTAAFAADYRALGAPLFFEVAASGIQPWSLGADAPKPMGKAFKPESIDREFRRHRELWNPEILGRVKKAADVTADSQLDLFNRGLLPVLEKFFSRELKTLLEASFSMTVECYRRVHSAEPDVRSLFPFLFRFVTAKIFMDRADARGWSDLGTPRQIFQKAEDHSGSGLIAKLPREFLHQRVLSTAWESISGSLNFQNLWVPDLAEIYESAFITKETRKQLGTHSTPHGLAEYVVNSLPWETLPLERRRVFEPFSGHGMLLASAMQRMGEDLDPALAPAKRHDYFRRRLTGVEKDPFAIEVCRLLLTLTDYPNHNSWDLHHDDVFTWSGWNAALNDCDVVLANPPYEPFKGDQKRAAGATKPNPPAEFLHRLMLSPPAMLGLILPQSFLSSPFFRDASRNIARRYGEVRIVELPKLFRYADNETIALMAHDRRERGTTVSVHYAEVLKDGVDAFLNDYMVVLQRHKTLEVPEGKQNISFRLAPEGGIFDHVNGTSSLGMLGIIRVGLQWVPRSDGLPKTSPRNDVASDTPETGYLQGCEKMRGNFGQFSIRTFRYLSLRKEHEEPKTNASQHPWNEKKVAVNRLRFERHSHWRIAAFADAAGLAFSKQFFAIWPSNDVSEFALAAILNSPVGNAFSFQEDLGVDNHIETLDRLPLPSPEVLIPGSTIDRLARRAQELFAEDTLLADMKARDWREDRREALIRLDAAVLDAYGLSATEQRKLLDQFTGHRRPVGFEFTGYFPNHFKDDITLSDFIRINYDWDETNQRRGDLIQMKIYGEGLNEAEASELEHLQHLTDLMVRLKDPRPVSRVDDLIEELKAEGKWPVSI